MQISIFRTILIGLLVGVLAFFAIKLVVILLLVGAIFKLSGKGKWRREEWRAHKLAYVDRVRNMSSEDYESFKSNFGKGRCHSHS